MSVFKYRSFLPALFLFFSSYVVANNPPSSWTILVYMESTHDMHEWAFKNLHDMIVAGPGEQVNVIVWLHATQKEAWLYKIDNKKLIEIDVVPVYPATSYNIIAAMRKVVSEYPAENYGLILWDHGYGILKPHEDENTNEWEVEPDFPSEGCSDQQPICSSCMVKHKGNYRGMLIDVEHSTFLDNDAMVYAISKISDQLLQGKKLGFVGMDLCMGAMIEHCYQLAPYVEYLVGSQECEMADGWDYVALMNTLKNNPMIQSRELVTTIIADYDRYYAPRSSEGRYTHSALDLAYIDSFKKHIDRLSATFVEFLEVDPDFVHVIHNARNQCLSFLGKPMYVDICDFYINLEKGLDTYQSNNEQEIAVIKQELREGCEIIKNMVIAHVGGFAVGQTHGVSIYFPRYYLDASYLPVLFARETGWLDFLKGQIATS